MIIVVPSPRPRPRSLFPLPKLLTSFVLFLLTFLVVLLPQWVGWLIFAAIVAVLALDLWLGWRKAARR